LTAPRLSLRRYLRGVRSFYRLSWAGRGLLLEAALWLALARLALWSLPFATVARWLGTSPHAAPVLADPEREAASASASAAAAAAAAEAAGIGWAVETLAGYTPWPSLCLVQAIAALGMARRRGLPATLYLGVANSETGDFSAHAWVSCGSQILTGAHGREQFTVIATFATGD
jgi:hypothetical protein